MRPAPSSVLLFHYVIQEDGGPLVPELGMEVGVVWRPCGTAFLP